MTVQLNVFKAPIRRVCCGLAHPVGNFAAIAIGEIIPATHNIGNSWLALTNRILEVDIYEASNPSLFDIFNPIFIFST